MEPGAFKLLGGHLLWTGMVAGDPISRQLESESPIKKLICRMPN
jgi:hypothetical protein